MEREADMKNKIIVAHPYQQHSFMTATAIKNIGLLEKYVTSTYDKKNSLTSIAKKFLKGNDLKRASNRKCDYLYDNEVKQICELGNLFMLLLHRIDKKRIYYEKLNRLFIKRFNHKLARYVEKNNICTVIVYDTVSYDFIKKIKDNNINTNIIIDMSAPSLPFMDLMFREYMDTQFDESLLKKEISSCDYNDQIERAKYEILNADYFLVASEFTIKSLEYLGVKREKIYKCRYGIKVDENKKCCNFLPNSDKKRVVFIGNVTEKKGFHIFEKIAGQLGYNKFEYHVIGKYEDYDPLILRNQEKMNFYGYVTHDKVLELCNSMDFIIFPSLADGFGFSVLEAMSRGVIPIVSENAGVSDLILNNVNGFKFNLKDIYEAVCFCREIANSSEKRIIMKKSVMKVVDTITWDKYNDDVKYAVEHILEGKNAI